MNKKKRIFLVGIVMALAAAFTGYYIREMQAIDVVVSVQHRGEPDSDLYYGYLFLSSGGPATPSFLQRGRVADVDDLSAWNGEVNAYLFRLREQECAPLHVKANCTVKDGRTVFTYDGIVTTETGETVPYHEEYTLNWTNAYHATATEIQPIQGTVSTHSE